MTFLIDKSPIQLKKKEVGNVRFYYYIRRLDTCLFDPMYGTLYIDVLLNIAPDAFGSRIGHLNWNILYEKNF